MKMECPNCGGNIIYAIGTDSIYCEYCNKKIDVSKINIKEYSEFIKKLREKNNEEQKKKVEYINRMLIENGSECVPEKADALYKCSYCWSEYIHNSKIKGSNCPYCFKDGKQKIGKPDNYEVSKIIPFELMRNTISRIICNNIGSNNFSPNNVFAMYSPFLVSYDEVTIKGDVRLPREVKAVSLSEKIITAKYIGKSLDKKTAESCIDYNFSKFVSFKANAFSDGIILDNIDSSIKRNEQELKENIKDNFNHELFLREGLKKIRKTEYDIEVKNIKEEVFLLPIYIYKVNFKHKSSELLINGQNGRLSGSILLQNKGTIRAYNLFSIIAFIMYFVISALIYPLIHIHSFIFGFFIFSLAMTFLSALNFVKVGFVKKIGNKEYKHKGIIWDKDLNIT